MKKLHSLIKWDILLQQRCGIYYACMFITILWLMAIRSFSEDLRLILLPVILLFDVAVIGFYFVSSIILNEKDENTFKGLVVTPLKAWQYLLSKVTSLTLLAVAAGAVVVLFARGISFNVLYLLLSTVLTSVFFVLIGFIIVSRFNSLSEYLSVSVLYFVILQLPLLDYFNVFENKLFYFIPTSASLVLTKAVFEPVFQPYIIYSAAYLLFWIIVAYILGHRSFYKHIVLNQWGK